MQQRDRVLRHCQPGICEDRDVTSFQLRVQKILVTSDGDIGKIRRDREDQKSESQTTSLHEKIRLENRETFKKLSEEEKLVRPVK